MAVNKVQSIFLSFITKMKIPTIKADTIYTIIRYLIFILTFALFSTLAAFQKEAYDGDGVLYHLFYEDIFQNGGNFFDWKLGPGMSVNLELILRCIAAFFTNNNIAASAVFDTFVQSVLLFFSMNFLFQELVRDNERPNERIYYSFYQFPLFFITLSCMYSGVTLTGVFNYYVPSDITLSFLIITFLIKFYRDHKNKYLIIFLICLGLSSFGCKKYFAFFVLPLLLTLFLFFLQEFKERRKNKVLAKTLIFSLLVILVADQIILKLIMPNFAGPLSYLGEQVGLATKLSNFIEEISFLRERGGYFHVVALLIFLSALVFLFFHASKLFFSKQGSFPHMNGDVVRKIVFPSSFIIILNIVIFWSTILATFVFTSFTPSKDIHHYSIFRYYSFACVWLLFFVAYKLTQTKIFSPNNFTRFNYLGYLSVFIVFSLAIYQLKTSPFTLKSVISYDANLVDMENARCIDENKEKYSLNHGVANFWIAQPVTSMSKKEIRVNQVCDLTNLLPYYWQNSKEWFLKGVSYSGKPYYNFIILSKNNPEGVEQVIRKKYGKETDSFECSDCSSIRKVLVYSYETNFDERLKHYWMNDLNSIFYKKERSEWSFYATELQTNGEISSLLEFNVGTLSTIANVTPIGLLTYGPYLKDLKKGQYEIILTYEIAKMKSSGSAISWDVVLNLNNVVVQGDVGKNKSGIQTYSYKLNLKGPTDLFEFRIFLNNSEAKVTLYNLKIRKL